MNLSLDTANSHTNRLVCLTAGLAIAIAGCSQSSTSDVDDSSSSQIAERLYAIAEDDSVTLPPAIDAFESATYGQVVEVMPTAIELQPFSPGRKSTTYPVASDLSVYKAGAEVDLVSLQPGDEVRLISERRGNRQNGWFSLVVRIEVDPAMPESVEEQADAAQPISKHETEAIEMPPAGKYERTFRGVVVDVDEQSLSIRNKDESEADATVFPTSQDLSVYRDGLVGDATLLRRGDHVTMIGESRGNRQDGYQTVVIRVGVDSDTAGDSDE